MYRSRFKQGTFLYVTLSVFTLFFTYIFKQVLHNCLYITTYPLMQRMDCEGERYKYGNSGQHIVLWEVQFENSVNVKAFPTLYQHML